MALTKTSTDGIKDDAVTQDKIAAGAVNTPEIATNAVNSDKLANNAVGGLQLQSLAVTANKIAAGEINNTHIGTGAINGDRLTDETVTLAKLPHGDGSSDGKFLRANNGADPTFETVNTDLVSDTSPQLGGNLASNGNDIVFAGTDAAFFGTDKLKIHHDGNHSLIEETGTGNLFLKTTGSEIAFLGDGGSDYMVRGIQNGAVELFHNDVKQLETHESGIILPKAVVRGMGGSKAILGGTIDPSADKSWDFSFNSNAHGTNNGYVFNVKFYMNHWNYGDYYKYIEFIYCGRGNTTANQRVNLINNLGTGSASWSNSHIDAATVLSGGTMNGGGAHRFTVTYDADGAPSYTSGYILEVSHSGQIGQVTIS